MSLALHLRALGRRNGSSTLAPCHDLSFSQQCRSLPRTRFLVGLPRQVFLEIIILDERGERGERRGRLGGEQGRRGGPAAVAGGRGAVALEDPAPAPAPACAPVHASAHAPAPAPALTPYSPGRACNVPSALLPLMVGQVLGGHGRARGVCRGPQSWMHALAWCPSVLLRPAQPREQRCLLLPSHGDGREALEVPALSQPQDHPSSSASSTEAIRFHLRCSLTAAPPCSTRCSAGCWCCCLWHRGLEGRRCHRLARPHGSHRGHRALLSLG